MVESEMHEQLVIPTALEEVVKGLSLHPGETREVVQEQREEEEEEDDFTAAFAEEDEEGRPIA